MKAEEALRVGKKPLFCKCEERLGDITTKGIAEALEAGDELAREIFNTVATYLGKGLSILIDILNPEVIVIGSIYGRQKENLEPIMNIVLEQEALDASRRVCKIVPAKLGEMIGDYAAVSVGIKAYRDFYRSEQKD